MTKIDTKTPTLDRVSFAADRFRVVVYYRWDHHARCDGPDQLGWRGAELVRGVV